MIKSIGRVGKSTWQQHETQGCLNSNPTGSCFYLKMYLGYQNACHANYQEIGRCDPRGECKKSVMCRQWSQERDPLWLWNPGQTWPEVQNMYQWSTAETNTLQNILNRRTVIKVDGQNIFTKEVPCPNLEHLEISCLSNSATILMSLFMHLF